MEVGNTRRLNEPPEFAPHVRCEVYIQVLYSDMLSAGLGQSDVASSSKAWV